MNFKKMALQHKTQFEQLLTGAGETITIRQPSTEVSSSSLVDKMRGTKSQEETVGVTKQIKAMISPAATRPEPYYSPATAALIALQIDSDLLIRAKLSDVSIDGSRDKSLFDTAKDVVIDDVRYQVKGTLPGGLPSVPPYIVYVSLKRIGR